MGEPLTDSELERLQACAWTGDGVTARDTRRLLDEVEALRAEVAETKRDRDALGEHLRGRIADMRDERDALKAKLEAAEAEASEGDSWMERARKAQENGVCGLCFGSEEHKPGCYVLECEERGARRGVRGPRAGAGGRAIETVGVRTGRRAASGEDGI